MKQFPSIVALVLSIFIFNSCDGEKDPVKTAVMEKILAENPQVAKFDFTKFEKVKDVTLADELSCRQRLFQTKEKVHAKKAAEYGKKKMTANAAKNAKLSDEATVVLARIEAYREAHSAQMDSVIYAVYTYDGYGKMADGGKVVADGQFATVSPEGIVFSIQPAGGNPFKGMGVAIPGYLEEIIGREVELSEE